MLSRAACMHCLALAGNRFAEGAHRVPLNIMANLVWRGGQRAYMECAFDRAPVQYLEVCGVPIRKYPLYMMPLVCIFLALASSSCTPCNAALGFTRQAAGTAGTMSLRDFVIPAAETGCAFELRDAVFLDALATRVTQQVQSRTVRTRAPAACALQCCREAAAGMTAGAAILQRSCCGNGSPAHAGMQ